MSDSGGRRKRSFAQRLIGGPMLLVSGTGAALLGWFILNRARVVVKYLDEQDTPIAESVLWSVDHPALICAPAVVAAGIGLLCVVGFRNIVLSAIGFALLLITAVAAGGTFVALLAGVYTPAG